MAKTYYTYRIRVANRDRVQVEKWDAQHQDKGQPSGALRYQEKLPEIAPLLEAVRNNELNDSNLVRSLGEALFDILFDDVLRQDFVTFYYQVLEFRLSHPRCDSLNSDLQDEIAQMLAERKKAN